MSLDHDAFRAARLVLSLRRAGVSDQRLVEAIETTPRELFVPRAFVENAWDDIELPIDCGQSLTRPLMAGVMIQALGPRSHHRVLEIGCGSGYCTALLSRLSNAVFSMDRYRTLVARAGETLERLGASGVVLALGDGRLGWPEEAPFDRIIVMGALEEPPDLLLAQLAPLGVGVIPLVRDGEQRLVRFERTGEGDLLETVLVRTRFTPLEAGFAREL
jgi:protein-L-isoaspartate(D-aspartate) O-methyltransferase